MSRIEHPKVFISYARGTEEYNNKVLSFANSLIQVGIDVVLDLFSLTLGNDLNSFMEKSILDKSISNVLMLIDENYTYKANARDGGVGKETQIISEKVYKDVESSKFVPIIFGRDSTGNIVTPAYLESRYFCDLTDSESYAENYMLLVRFLYGVNSFKKPDLGSRPAWVDVQLTPSFSSFLKLDSLINNEKSNNCGSVKEFLDDLSKTIISVFSTNSESESEGEYIRLYERFFPIRSEYILFLKKSISIKEIEKEIGLFFEITVNKIKYITPHYDLILIFVHELFLYTIAYFFKRQCYSLIGYLFKKSYFISNLSSSVKKHASYLAFYSGQHQKKFDCIYNRINQSNVVSPVADFWIKNIDPEYITSSDLVDADLLCTNYSIYGKHFYDQHCLWFPLLYLYESDFFIENLSKRMESKEYLSEILKVFNYDSPEEFKSKIIDVNIKNSGDLSFVYFKSNLSSAPLIGEFVELEKIGGIP